MSCEELITRIREAKKAIAQAKKIKCVCSSFVLQYEGECGCARGVALGEAEANLRNIIKDI